MRKLSVCLLLSSASMLAQTADVAYFRAVMLPSNEVPATSINAKGMADMVAHVVRDNSGQIVSGTVDFLVRVNLPTDNTATGLHIHSGGPTVAGPVVINTGLTGGAGQALKAGGDIVHRPAQIDGTNAAALAALRGLFTDPTQYYVNVGPGQINAQVPVDVPAGQQAVVVKNTVGPSASFNVTVVATAPAIFFSPVAAVLKNVDFSLVGAANPARAGDVILVYCTGLGATSATLATGTLVPSTTTYSTTAPVTATIGGNQATVVYAIASPGFAGLYQVAITVPPGLGPAAPRSC